MDTLASGVPRGASLAASCPTSPTGLLNGGRKFSAARASTSNAIAHLDFHDSHQGVPQTPLSLSPSIHPSTHPCSRLDPYRSQLAMSEMQGTPVTAHQPRAGQQSMANTVRANVHSLLTLTLKTGRL